MIRRENEKEPTQSSESILEKEFVDSILESAKEELRIEGTLSPTLFLRLESGKRVTLPVSLHESDEDRQFYLATLAKSFAGIGQPVEEAVFLVTGWYVESEESKDNRRIVPSRHPKRQEVLSLVGRNTDRTSCTLVIQPFRRNQKREILFENLVAAEYAVSTGKATEAVWFLDPLFPKRTRLF